MNKKFHATRFAPSPTGPLHFGSLVSAFISYVIARQYGAQWLLRIEDIDRQRCLGEHTKDIIDCLHAHGLVEDKPVIYQSQRSYIYDEYLNQLINQELAYGCTCSRKQYKERQAYYDGYCRKFGHPLANNAVRYLNLNCSDHFSDLHLGFCKTTEQVLAEDIVLRRADGQFAYNHAVVVDDIEQNIDLVIRGADLVDATPVQISLFERLCGKSPAFMHTPIAVHSAGIKYAKQSYSPAVKPELAKQNLQSCLLFMGVEATQIPQKLEIAEIVQWTISHWSLNQLPKRKEIVVNMVNNVYSPDSEI